jgi:deazaflavin-dependent oxidoreductase (nitroreductase family)
VSPAYLDIVDRSWPLLRRLAAVHILAYRATNGRLGQWIPGLPPMLLLDHTGARSGARRTAALLYIHDGENLVIVASKGGHPRHPAWFHNLRAHPDTSVQVGSEHRAVHARVADPEARQRLWPRVVDAYPGYAEYQRRTDRRIPLVILEPRAAHKAQPVSSAGPEEHRIP